MNTYRVARVVVSTDGRLVFFTWRCACDRDQQVRGEWPGGGEHACRVCKQGARVTFPESGGYAIVRA